MDHLSASNPALHRALSTLQTNQHLRDDKKLAYAEKSKLVVESRQQEALMALSGLNTKEPLDKILPKPFIADCQVLARVDTCRAQQFERDAAEGGECQ